jgi:DNA-binding response OmpR family regulator
MVATRVLVVEDDRNYRRLVRVLDSAGYAVDLARNVAEAEH